MRVSPLLVALGLAMLALAGCTTPEPTTSSTTSSTPPTVITDSNRVVVHGVDGRPMLASAYPGELPVVGQRYVAHRGSGEPTIGVNSRGAALYPSIAFDAVPSTVNSPEQLPRTIIYITKDNGTTWMDRTPTIGNAGAAAAAPASLDPYVYADPVTGRLFTIDLYVGCADLSYTDDDGLTWTTNPIACGIPVNDHQTLTSGPVVPPASPNPVYPRVLYYCVNQLGPSTCTHSFDGGISWIVGQPAFGAQAPGGEGAQSQCGGLNGHVVSSEKTGTVFLPAGCGQAEVARSTDNGATWSDHVVDNKFGFDGHDGSVAVDHNGTVYYFFLDGKTLPRLAVSHDDGRTWGPAMNVTAPGVTTAKFPAITAGTDGRVAFLYVGSNPAHGFHYADRKGSGYRYAAEVANLTWNAYVGFSLNAHEDAPLFATTTFNDPSDPVARGDCSGRCYKAPDDGMFDFLDIQNRPDTGQVWASLVDMCHEECAAATGTAKDPESARGAVGIQFGGTLLGSRFQAPNP